ncbi:SDR family NAD(P)-dependent oxidoreductase [Chryseobacterium daecheongense]|uniref:NAD(P)-dependent dehydrogenase (Short-subunit alcohol dehydrogenase family) n=1 Tax=Chryseobacterium daecheongense TaxID=192389 RepID=A0A3N0W5E5_9FLAO|nr:SDR family NAD(P)-dependent oxidoreductase [Chryseobacterium daecheongense]ROI00278.1 SDR family NAD(P)-dependent oxidoreductase [Chryseobacterium daecheongense]TDX94762.1 NAD(P)-dependent dehydrogenase (short-subunit alcohol dehydrogenase family) [Chryseobacterium daecheongense]
MGRIFITGSSDGLGMMAAKLLMEEGHQVVLHARNEKRAKDALKANPKAESVLIGDLSSIAETVELAAKANATGEFDAIIHNAAIGYTEGKKILTEDKLPHVFAINSLAPYILTSLIERPKRLIYLSSGLHRDGDSSLTDILWEHKPWNGFQAYADSKLHNVFLAFAVANKWKNVFSSALEPGWVATKMGGPGAPDSLEDAPQTQVWLAASTDQEVQTSGKYFYHKKLEVTHPDVNNTDLQELFLKKCADISGIKFPMV